MEDTAFLGGAHDVPAGTTEPRESGWPTAVMDTGHMAGVHTAHWFRNYAGSEQHSEWLRDRIFSYSQREKENINFWH